MKIRIYIKTISITAATVVVAYLVAIVAVEMDSFLNLQSYQSLLSVIAGLIILLIGLVFRTWAAHTFYSNKIKIISAKAQHRLLRVGPYKYSRNPLYVGIVLIFLGIIFILGSYIGIILAIINFLIWDLWLKFFEEKNLEQAFGEEYRNYKKSVRRWL